MQAEFPNFSQAKVLVIGDVMLDRYWYGKAGRISPEAPVPVVNIKEVEDRPGGAANVALNIASLGASTQLISAVGEDESASILTNQLQAVGVDCQFQPCAQPTITKLRVISNRQQQSIRLDFEDDIVIDNTNEFLKKIESVVQEVNIIILSDYGKGTLFDPQQIITIAHQNNIPVLVDPKGNDFSRYQGATLITPNLNELEAVVGSCENEQELVDKGSALIEQLQLDALLVTRGEHGMTLLRQSKAEQHFPARARHVYDVTGAGDTVIATLAASLAAEMSLEHSVTLANLAAGLVVTEIGTTSVSAPELYHAVMHAQGAETGIMTQDQLSVALERARKQGEKIVMTNGCFDIIHAGHVGYLNQARQLGDRLIVAINDDASVTKLKGVGRPINSVDRRMAVLAGLSAVDWVVTFSEGTPENLLTLFKPDILVKGGDYNDTSEVVGAPIVEQYGGKVKVLDFIDSESTTTILEKVIQNNEEKM